MPLSNLEIVRERIHARHITVEGFRRDDGLWDIEGCLLDTKDHDFNLYRGVRLAGEAVHCMRVRWTIDSTLTILAVEAVMDALPYPGVCDAIQERYQKLIGLRVGSGFRRAVNERFGRENGCSHITELVGAMAAGTVQTLAPYLHKESNTQPFQIGGCHAWAQDGPLVREHYPQWYSREETNGTDGKLRA